MNRLVELGVLIISIPLMPIMISSHYTEFPIPTCCFGCGWCATKERVRYIMTGKFACGLCGRDDCEGCLE
jgi:hypothetical protein